jgi:hypothetical protein
VRASHIGEKQAGRRIGHARADHHGIDFIVELHAASIKVDEQKVAADNSIARSCVSVLSYRPTSTCPTDLVPLLQ